MVQGRNHLERHQMNKHPDPHIIVAERLGITRAEVKHYVNFGLPFGLSASNLLHKFASEPQTYPLRPTLTWRAYPRQSEDGSWYEEWEASYITVHAEVKHSNQFAKVNVTPCEGGPGTATLVAFRSPNEPVRHYRHLEGARNRVERLWREYWPSC